MTMNLLSIRGRCFTLTSFPRPNAGAALRVRATKMEKSGTTLAVVPDGNTWITYRNTAANNLAAGYIYAYLSITLTRNCSLILASSLASLFQSILMAFGSRVDSFGAP